MKWYLGLLAVFVLFTFIGCDDDEIIVEAPEQEARYNLTIDGLPDEYVAPNSLERLLPLTVSVRYDDGTVASGVNVRLSVVFGEGSVTPENAASDGGGMVDGLYRITMPSGESTVQITAIAGSQSISKTIRLEGTPLPASMRVIPETTRLIVPQNEDAEINIEISVRDEKGVGAHNVKLQYELAPALPVDSTIFGSISGDRFTDRGKARAVFRTNGESGQVKLIVSVDEEGLDEQISAETNLTVDSPGSITMTTVPEILTAFNPDEELTSTVSLIVTDAGRNGIPNLRVNFTTDAGRITQTAATNENGTANGVLTVYPTDLEDPEKPDEIHIAAEIESYDWQAAGTIGYRPGWLDEYQLTLGVDRKFIWADGQGLSYARLTSILKDGNGQILPGKEIVFTSSFNHSAVGSPVVTDSLGRALTVFDDAGVPSIDPNTGEPDSVVITARYKDTETQTKIMIREPNPVSTINLSVNARQLRANSGDSTAVRATCYFGDGSPATEGVEVRFEAVYGRFTRSVVPVTGRSGAANTFYIAGRQITTDTLVAYVWTPEDTAVSNGVLVDLISGPPASIRLYGQPTVIASGDSARMTAIVLDTSRNPVRQGTYVTFSTTKGVIDQAAITDSDGEATAYLAGGNETGEAIVTAEAQGSSGPIQATRSIDVIGGTPNSIEAEANPAQIFPAGSGGLETSVLTATLRDRNGNLTSGEQPVIFELINAPERPEGPILNDTAEIVQVTARNGVATAYLNSGTAGGAINIAGYTFRDEEREDTLRTYTIVLITGGQPYEADVDINSDGMDAGGGAWALEIAVRVWDVYGNPVRDGIPVTFAPIENLAVQPAVTGNQNRYGETTPGTAYSRLVFNGEDAFREIELTARAPSRAGEIVRTREFVLPLQRGQLTLNVDPANWMFNEDNPDAVIRIWCTLRDGHGTLINDAPILFRTERGRLYWKDFSNDEYIEFYPNPARRFTGIVDRQNLENPGQATVYLLTEVDDIYLDPFTLEVLIQIDAEVEGYDDVFAEPEFILFTRPG